MMNRIMMTLAMAVPLAACQTTSFRVPKVNPQQKAYVGGVDGCAARAAPANEPDIGHDVEGAMTLTENYLLSYRCAADELANGRQYFQLPAVAAAAVGLVGPTLGLGPDGSLIAGTTAAISNSGYSYYAPRDKMLMVSSAISALVCIKQASVAVSYYEEATKPEGAGEASVQALADAQGSLSGQLQLLLDQERRLKAEAADPEVQRQLTRNREIQLMILGSLVNSSVAAAEAAGGGTVTISAERQYYDMVTGEVFNVEDILRRRLGDAGSADPKDLFEKLGSLTKEHAEAVKKLEGQKKTATQGAQAYTFADAPEAKKPGVIELENNVLRPLLQICVLRAKA